jgi:hypothetical protein
MTIKHKILAFGLLSFSSLSYANDNNVINTTFFKQVAVSTISANANQTNQGKYQILISKVDDTSNNSNKDFLSSLSSRRELGKPIWIITGDQLPINEHVCMKLNLIICDDDSIYCYKSCLTQGLYPKILAFDNNTNKVYFMVGTHDIGSGGGPAFLFVGDVNKQKVTLLHLEGYGESGSLSPSGKYLVIDGGSVIKLYDTQNNTRYEINTSENFYDKDRKIRHYLRVKKWMSDTQFSYINTAHSYTSPADEQPFLRAKEVIYDITNKKTLSEHNVTKADAETL